MNKKKNWHCYICGNKLLKVYYLCSMRNSTGSVFLCCSNKRCVERMDKAEVIIVKIREEL